MIGIFGGTFDPVHYGHLRCAQELLQDLPLDEVRLVPCRIPPHRDTPHANVEQRLRMLKAALDGAPGLRVDDRELSREGLSYTVDTLHSLRTELGSTPLCLIVGMDAFNALDRWHRWQELIDLAHIVVAHRPGWMPPQTGAVAELLNRHVAQSSTELHAQPAGCILPWPITALAISSSAIRAQVTAGKSPRFLVPEAVARIIAAEGLYGATT
jgi:nicotinate-nucleotide adenylyltransferase